MQEMDIKKILAVYDDSIIRVYQAYNNTIADECLKKGTFGGSFKMSRMTWIKPSFLWMMYRCGWASKEDQERVLAIDITRTGFEEILKEAVLSTYNNELYSSFEEWQKALKCSNVRCQWDPDKDVYGNNLTRRAIQLGLIGKAVGKYVHEYIVRVKDITEDVKGWKDQLNNRKLNVNDLPQEREYPVSDDIKGILKIK